MRAVDDDQGTARDHHHRPSALMVMTMTGTTIISDAERKQRRPSPRP
jgi:hypothetical protein